ncbi:hypothetical protein T4B_14295 [Trichinella pseudospiralis]|uniref:Uncharacterized protein n=1 Tax=Trichinella pseudospiralis TaxID=6337 RepID=A0A0V1J5T2_TRIPS|nr:hypothetical protein T4B_14295 [Trichinella pseudospiralis]
MAGWLVLLVACGMWQEEEGEDEEEEEEEEEEIE